MNLLSVLLNQLLKERQRSRKKPGLSHNTKLLDKKNSTYLFIASKNIRQKRSKVGRKLPSMHSGQVILKETRL